MDRGLWLVREDDEDSLALADLMLTQAAIQRQSGERARAGITLGRARELSSGEHTVLVEMCTSNLLLEDGDARRAQEHGDLAVKSAEDLGAVVLVPFARSIAAGCAIALGSHIDAHEHIQKGLDQLTDADTMARCMLLRRRASLLRVKGELENSIKVLRDVAEIAMDRKYGLILKKVALAMADSLEEMDDFKGAVEQHKIAWRLQNETRIR